MKVFQLKKDLQNYLTNIKNNLNKIGLVPTMGALHKGHLALVEASLSKSDYTVVSIFVNPTQFDNHDDLIKYPKTLIQDLKMLKDLNDKIIVYTPVVSDIYDGETKSISFDFDGLEMEMEGKFRPGHFNGVGTIVKKLFEIVKPDLAFFGEKDFQQLQIIKKLTEKEKFSIQIIPIPIHREIDGLAMSSRNKRLTKEMRKKAPFIHKTLLESKKLWQTETIEKIKKFVYNKFKEQEYLKIEYFEITDEKTLKPANKKISGNKYRGFIVVYAGDVRLIDNIAY